MNPSVSIAVHGASGRMGRAIVRLALQDPATRARKDPERATAIGFRAIGACGARAGCGSAARVFQAFATSANITATVPGTWPGSVAHKRGSGARPRHGWMGIPWIGGRWNRLCSTNVIVDYSRMASICGYVSFAYATSLPGKAAPFHSFPPPLPECARNRAPESAMRDRGRTGDARDGTPTGEKRQGTACLRYSPSALVIFRAGHVRTRAHQRLPRHASARPPAATGTAGSDWVSARAGTGPLLSPMALHGNTGRWNVLAGQHFPVARRTRHGRNTCFAGRNAASGCPLHLAVWGRVQARRFLAMRRERNR